jgi:O-antigen biosynthesis protein
MNITTSVIICAYTESRWQQLLCAAESIRTQTASVDELLIVIDHNDELRYRAEQAMPWAQVIASSGPPGLSGARNTGIAASTGEVVLFLDDDAVAEPDWVSQLLAHCSDPHVLGVGGAAQPTWERSAPPWWPAEFGWVVGCSYRGQPTSTAPVRNLMGCNMSLRRTVIEAVGGFDDVLGRGANNAFGCEETELCIRAQQFIPDGQFIFEPKAVVHHWVPGSRSSWSYFRARCRAEGVSKARVARTVGRSAALSAENVYTRRVLPAGIARNIRDGLAGDLAAFARAGAIAAGLSITAFSFLSAKTAQAARVSSRAASQSQDEGDDPSTSSGRTPPTNSGRIGALPTVAPVLPLIVNLNEPLPAIEESRSDGTQYEAAHCLILLDGDPLARIRLELSGGTMTPHQLADELWRRLSTQIIHYRRTRRRLVPDTLPPHGLASASPAELRALLPAGAAVVVATKDRPTVLRECLDSILKAAVKPERLIVVDNASASPETAELVREFAAREPAIHYVHEDKPGLARAHNAALPYITSPLVAFTADDAVVDDQWLKRLVQAFAVDESVASVTGMIAPRELDTLPQQWLEGNLTWDTGPLRTCDAQSQRPADPLFPYISGAFGSGANMAFRTCYLRERGGFDEALGAGTIAMGGDDLAAFYDVITSGSRLFFEPAAIVLHQHPREYAALKRQTYRYSAGLGAHLTRCLLRRPLMALVFLRRGSAVIRRGTEAILPATAAALPPYPSELNRLQMRGLVSGPGRYLLSRWHARLMHRTPG